MWIKQLFSTNSPTSVRYHSQGFGFPPEQQTLLYDRFALLAGASQQALANAHVVLIGCGGLGGEVGHGLVRKGVGRLTLCDYDEVDVSNLARQQFYPKDVGKKKALVLARNLSQQATGHTLLEGQARSFQAALASGVCLDGDIAVIGVDNNATRLATAQYYWTQHIPAIFMGVDAQATRGYVFVQTAQPDDPCFRCLYPNVTEDRRIYGCAGASIEILKIMAGVALYAIDSLLMNRPRPWNCKMVFLDQGGDGQATIGQRPTCPLCGENDGEEP